ELGVVAGLWGAPILLRPWVPSVRLPQTIRVENGHLTISGPFRTRSVPLSECRWFEAYTIHDPALEGAPVAPCIGIYARKLLNARWHRKYRPHISVGLSENTRDVWRALLTSAGIPKGRRRRRHEQWIVLTGVLVGFALARGAYAVISAQEEFEPAALLIAYLSHVIAPVIGAVYASVLAGNDWYAEEKGIASILVFGLLPLPAAFACLLGGAGMQTTLIYVGGSSLLALAFGVEITRRR
ncbi:MAG: hypothetical protein HY000_00835, partial [Planctomycetes bacterium]|nr:hypothetical protein [Planctomycetota bacterium]